MPKLSTAPPDAGREPAILTRRTPMIETTLPQCWIAVVAQDRAERARAGGYAELNHGRAGILELLHAGDAYVTYSPRMCDPKGDPVQAFTTLGYVRDATL